MSEDRYWDFFCPICGKAAEVINVDRMLWAVCVADRKRLVFYGPTNGGVDDGGPMEQRRALIDACADVKFLREPPSPTRSR
jgi:hypothetical protein